MKKKVVTWSIFLSLLVLLLLICIMVKTTDRRSSRDYYYFHNKIIKTTLIMQPMWDITTINTNTSTNGIVVVRKEYMVYINMPAVDRFYSFKVRQKTLTMKEYYKEVWGVERPDF